MVNKYDTSISQNPFKGLNATDIAIYYHLYNLSILKPSGNRDFYIHLNGWIKKQSNKLLGEIMDVRPETISRSIGRLILQGLIEAKYIPNGYGTIRRFRIIKKPTLDE